jgi:hypothetical protein
MSLSFRERSACTLPVALLLLVYGLPAVSDEFYFQPRMDVSVNGNTNRELLTNGPTSPSEGYYANFGGTMNYRTPDSTIILRPQLGYEDYPQVGEHDTFIITDLYSDFRSERSDFLLTGQVDHRSTYASELADPTFNPVNPQQPTTPNTGILNPNGTRTLGTIVPTYTYDLTRRLSWGVGGVIQDVNYTGPGASQYVPYDYYLGSTSLGWAATSRLGTKLTAYGSYESAKDGSGWVNGGGMKLGFDYQWSSQFASHLDVLAERDHSDTIKPRLDSETSTSGGATVNTTWKGQVSSLMFAAGRTFTPSGAGGKYALDEVRFEYHRDLTQRWKLTAAGVYDRFTPVTTVFAGSDYSYVNVEASLKWMWTPTWHLAGGFQYLFNKLGPPIGSASNDMIYVGFGYEGLTR